MQQLKPLWVDNIPYYNRRRDSGVFYALTEDLHRQVLTFNTRLLVARYRFTEDETRSSLVFELRAFRCITSELDVAVGYSAQFNMDTTAYNNTHYATHRDYQNKTLGRDPHPFATVMKLCTARLRRWVVEYERIKQRNDLSHAHLTGAAGKVVFQNGDRI